VPLLLVAELVLVGMLVVELVVVGELEVLVLVLVEELVGEELVLVVVVVLWQFLAASLDSVEAPCWRLATSLLLTPELDRLSTELLKLVTAFPAWLQLPWLTAAATWSSWLDRVPD
jgi:hypothetical protein